MNKPLDRIMKDVTYEEIAAMADMGTVSNVATLISCLHPMHQEAMCKIHDQLGIIAKEIRTEREMPDG